MLDTHTRANAFQLHATLHSLFKGKIKRMTQKSLLQQFLKPEYFQNQGKTADYSQIHTKNDQFFA